MSSRRHFLTLAAAGAATLASNRLLAGTEPGSLMPTRGPITDQPLPRNGSWPRFRPQTRIGLGGVAIGNGFNLPNTDAQSQAALAAAYASGVRYFDTSPWYGLGLSERRFGHFLHNQAAEDYVLSTKVGRLLTATHTPPKTMWADASPFDYRYDYSAEGTRRSIEDSLQRLGVSQIDIVYIHDLAPSNGDMGDKWTEHYAQAVKGAMPELTRMREEGLIKAWGMGVNDPEPALRCVEDADPDIFLLACQYSLLDHERALQETFPKMAERDISVVVGSPLLAGYLAGRDRYLYSGRVPEWAPAKRDKVMAVCKAHGVDLRTAALQFAEAPEVVAAIAPGARTAEQAQANSASMRVRIPGEFWADLKAQQLISAEAPVPA